MGLVSELRRRNVLRMAVLYAVAAWLIMQVAEVLMTLATLPEWTGPVILVLLAVGFPIALIFSWFYELTPEGISLEKDVAPGESITHVTSRRMDFIVISLLSAAVILFAYDKWWVSEPPEKSIAVLPFVNMSGDESNDPFTVGIHDDMLTHISKISEIKVISRTSVVRLDKEMSIPDIGRLLGVATVLEGGVQRLGDRVRINVQLIDAGSDKHLWAETFDRELTTQSIFAIQSEIAAAITDKLQATLSPKDEANLEKLPTRNLQAYEAYMLGKQRIATRTRADLLSAADYFEKAVALDPDYALAWVGVAEVNLLLNNYGHLPLSDALAKVEPALSAALQLDDQLGAAHTAAAFMLLRQGDNDAARAAFERAIDLDPNYATPYHWYGDMLINAFGEPEAAIPLLLQARRLDPLSAVIAVTLGEALEAVGGFDEALALYQKALEIDPDYHGAYFVTAQYHYTVLAQLDESVRWYLQELALDPARDPSFIGLVYLDLGDDVQAEHWIDRAMQIHPTWYFSNAALVFLHRYRGDELLALNAARRLSEIAPGNNASLWTMVAFGRYEEALQTFGPFYPGLSCDVEPVVTRTSLAPAINLSLALERTGELECAGRLLTKSLEQMRQMPRLGARGYGIADVEVYARQGRIRLALDTLRQAIDRGYRRFWWSQGESSPHMTAMLDEPEFQAMMDEVRADMAAQLERVRAMEASGELEPIPDIN
jgi:TolB-like protein/Tfp pilus assembly protein PilF